MAKKSTKSDYLKQQRLRSRMNTVWVYWFHYITGITNQDQIGILLYLCSSEMVSPEPVVRDSLVESVHMYMYE